MDFDQLNKELDKIINYMEEQFGGLQVGKANPKLIENLEVYVPSYDDNMKINALASVGVVDAQTLRVEAWDKSVLSAIDKGIQDANLGLNPSNMGEHLLIKFPLLTTERRQVLNIKQSTLFLPILYIGLLNNFIAFNSFSFF